MVHVSINFLSKKFPRNSISERYMNHSGSIYRHPSNSLNYECGEKSDSFAIAKGALLEMSSNSRIFVNHSARCLSLRSREKNVARVHLRDRHSSPKTRYIFLFVAAQYFRRFRENVYARWIPKGIAFLHSSANSAIESLSLRPW